MGLETYLLVLLVFMILGALVAVETRTLISSVISLGALGIGMSLAFLFIGAPDLAIVQIAVEVILLVFLIRATIGREIVPAKGHLSWPSLLPAAALVAFILVFGVFAFQDLPEFGTPIISLVKASPSNRYLKEGLTDTGSANIVTSIILDYRGYDTLGEATVLFAAIIGALTVLRARAKARKEK